MKEPGTEEGLIKAFYSPKGMIESMMKPASLVECVPSFKLKGDGLPELGKEVVSLLLFIAEFTAEPLSSSGKWV